MKYTNLVVAFSGILLLSSANTIFSQEILTPLESNAVIENFLKQKPADQKSFLLSDTISLPFFDDFSKTNVFPDAVLWTDNRVFINTNFCDHPLSFGVATFDALDSEGHLYSSLGPLPTFADVLTSKPIHLSDTIHSVVLSFFYQPGGIGDAPEPEDSLILEFLRKDGDWEKVGGFAGSGSLPFKQVLVPVTDTNFLFDGFRFRFRNKVSNTLAVTSNCDFWNLDYIRLNKNRSLTDTALADVAFTQPSHSVLYHYTAMPMSHYNSFNSNEFNGVTFNFTNHDNISRNITTLFTIYKTYPTRQYIDSVYDRVDNYTPYSNASFIFSFDENPFPQISDPASYEITCMMETDDSSQFQSNNRVKSKQDFLNYYAYDDGSSEQGYSLESVNGRVAYRFRIYKEDTLRGVQMFFNHTHYPLPDTTAPYFKLTVWDHQNGKPGNIRYQQSNIRPFFKDSLNQFVDYILDSAIAVHDTIYIGWVQISNKKMNMGFDKNNPVPGKIFYNLGGNWVTSALSNQGSLMMRPIVGNRIASQMNIKPQSKPLVVFPNPANDVIHITIKANQNYLYEIYNITGILVQSGICNSSQIEVSGLARGLYVIRLKEKSNISVAKFLINR